MSFVVSGVAKNTEHAFVRYFRYIRCNVVNWTRWRVVLLLTHRWKGGAKSSD